VSYQDLAAPYLLGSRERRSRGKIVNTIISFIGEVTFTALNRDRYWLNVLPAGGFCFLQRGGLSDGGRAGTNEDNLGRLRKAGKTLFRKVLVESKDSIDV
jgi:hypothetical protein